MDLESLVEEFPDFPKKGILFRDFNPILRKPGALEQVAEELSRDIQVDDIDAFAGIESRGFIIASIMALKHGKGMITLRKAGKLPGKTAKTSYTVEYGKDIMEVQRHAVRRDQRVMICDDLLATGGTAAAAASLVEEVGGKVAGFLFVIELADLKGASKIGRYDRVSLLTYGDESA